MQRRDLAVAGAFEVTPTTHLDERGSFAEWFRLDLLLDHLGAGWETAQANVSRSHRGVLRGIHSCAVPPGQAKYVTCMTGSVLDVVVDLRVGSPTFGRSEAVLIDSSRQNAVFLPVGLGHGFMALEDDATVVYLCSAPYSPEAEFAVHPLDPDLAIAWPVDLAPVLSPKDAAAPSLAELLAAGRLPVFEGPV